MKITISPTKEVVRVGGQLVRVWEGTSAMGVPVRALVAYVGAEEGYDHYEFDKELLSTPDPMDEPLTASKLVNIIKRAERK